MRKTTEKQKKKMHKLEFHPLQMLMQSMQHKEKKKGKGKEKKKRLKSNPSKASANSTNQPINQAPIVPIAPINKAPKAPKTKKALLDVCRLHSIILFELLSSILLYKLSNKDKGRVHKKKCGKSMVFYQTSLGPPPPHLWYFAPKIMFGNR